MSADTIPLWGSGGTVAWSPAGEQLAVNMRTRRKDQIELLTATGAVTDTLVLGGDEPPEVTDLQWSADGRALYVLSQPEEASEIHQVPVDPSGRFTGDPALVYRVRDRIVAFTVSGDGQRIFYSLTDRDPRPWVVDVGEDASVSDRRRLLTGN